MIKKENIVEKLRKYLPYLRGTVIITILCYVVYMILNEINNYISVKEVVFQSGQTVTFVLISLLLAFLAIVIVFLVIGVIWSLITGSIEGISSAWHRGKR